MNNLKNMEDIKGNSPFHNKLKRKFDVEGCEEKPKQLEGFILIRINTSSENVSRTKQLNHINTCHNLD
jgi:hypothetical protein